MPVRNATLARFAPPIIGAVASVVLARTGFMSLFFLLPLGILAFRVSPWAAWTAALFAVLGNFAAASVLALMFPETRFGFLADGGYTSAAMLAFVWVAVPSRRGPQQLRLRTVYRISLAAFFVSLCLIPIVAAARQDEGLFSFVRRQAELLAELYARQSGADVVERSLAERFITADSLLAAMGYISLRGAAVVSHWLFLGISLQLSRRIARMSGSAVPWGRIQDFRLDNTAIWFLSASLLAVLGGSVLKVEFLEIPGWNILVLCILIFGVQGCGIVLHGLGRPGIPRGLRVMARFLIILVALSPGINAFAAGVLVLLGIAETWLPLRVPYTNGPSSTPGV